jgi:P-type Mg2+ transporter
MIPADLRILGTKDLFINQATIAGESLPAEKFAKAIDPDARSSHELENIQFMGPHMVTGTAIAGAVEAGPGTYFGVLAQRVVSADRAPTTFSHGGQPG